MNRRLLLGLAPAAMALAAAAAFAQPPGPGADSPGVRTMIMRHGGPGHGDFGPEMKAMHEAMAKQHLEDMKTVLRLRPDQEPALKAFLESHGAGMGGPTIIMRRESGPDGKPGEMAPPKPMTTPERLAEMAKHEDAMAAAMKQHRDALAKFYAALSPDQQKVFDALQRLHGPGGHGGMGGPGMRRIEIRRGGPPMPGHEPD